MSLEICVVHVVNIPYTVPLYTCFWEWGPSLPVYLNTGTWSVKFMPSKASDPSFIAAVNSGNYSDFVGTSKLP